MEEEWSIFKITALSHVTSFNIGETEIANLIGKYQHFFEDSEEACKTTIIQCRDFRCLVSGQVNSLLCQYVNNTTNPIGFWCQRRALFRHRQSLFTRDGVHLPAEGNLLY